MAKPRILILGSSGPLNRALIGRHNSGALTFQSMPPDLLGWRGWAYLNGAKAAESDPFNAGYDLTATRPANPPKADAPAVWHERIVVFTQTEEQITDTYNVVHASRQSFESTARKRVEDAIAGMSAWIAAETGGRLRFEPEVTVESEPMRRDSFGPEFAQEYFGPRINGGGYEAEDKVFRGPYQGAIYVLPGTTTNPTPSTSVNGTPVQPVYEYVPNAPDAPGDLEVRLHRAWLTQVQARLAERQAKVEESGSPANVWSEATATAELPTDVLLSRIETPPPTALFSGSDGTDPVNGLKTPTAPSFKTAFTDVTLAADPDHGQVVHVAEKGVDRNGGFALPARADGQPLALVSKTPSLTFEIKTTAHDPIGVIVKGKNGAAEYSLGRQWLSPTWAVPGVTEAAIATDGKWQKISLDLRPFAKATNSDEVMGVEIAPTRAAVLMGREQAGPIELDLDNVNFTSDSPTALLDAPKPDATSGEPEERALFALKSEQSSPSLVALLVDKSELVRLNAARKFNVVKDPTAQANLISDVNDLDPQVASAALWAMVFQDPATALPTVRHTIRFGITPYARETAAVVLGQTKAPGEGDNIVSLIVDRHWQCRLASIKALGNLPGKEAAIRRMAFINQENPEIKLAVTETADPTDEYEMRKLLWSAVNEPSDLVRAESDIKLVQSPDATIRAEGFKGVRDDSPTVRLILLDYLSKHPNEQNRAALRLAVTDHSPKVRAAALVAFAALEKGAESDEIANVMQDRDPGVQLALLALSKKSGLKLSDQTRQIMATSPDQRVKQALAGTGGGR